MPRRQRYAGLARHRLRRTRSRRRQRAPWRVGFAGLMFVALTAMSGVLAVAAVLNAVIAEYERFGGSMEDAAAVIARLPQGGSRVYDRHGVLLYEYRNADVRRYVPLSEISPWMIKATIATEDASFWVNGGLNLQGIARAGVENFTPFADHGWLRGSGGSSITQQLAKNIYIEPEERFERTIGRKLREMVLALHLTSRYSKEQVLEWYLNSISYGGQYVGVEAASQGYFGKPASELTIGEAALLAGIPQRPAAYEPVANPEAAQARQRDVLDLMVRHGAATEAEAADAHAQALDIQPPEVPMQAPHFVFGPVARAIEALFGPEALARGGLEITTTLDFGLQQEANRILDQWITKYEGLSGGHNGALYALDARDGSVLVYIGSRDYARDDIQGRNDNVRAQNSPGSTLKPFTFMSAFMNGWSPGTGVLDVPMTLEDQWTGQDFVPRDPTQHYLGVTTAAIALGNSLNVPAVEAIRFAGVDKTVQLLRRMGMTTINPSPGYYGPALTLGGVDVTLEDLVYSYSVLAGGGVMRGVPAAREHETPARELDPAVVLQVTDTHGKVLYKRARAEERRIVPESYAYLVTHALSDGRNQCITWGACGALNLPGRPSAQKTGTSEPFENTKTLIGDTWSVGYTPQIVSGTWFGNSDNQPMRNIYSTTVSWQVWKDFMQMAHQRLGLPPEPFVRPPTVVERQVCAVSGKLPTEVCPTHGRYTSLFAAEALQGPRPVALFDDWWQRTPTEVRLVLPPDLQRWSGVGEWAARLGVGPVVQGAVTPTPEGNALNVVPGSATPSGQPLGTPRQGGATSSQPGGGVPRGTRPTVVLATPGGGTVVSGSLAISGTASSGALEQVTVEVSASGGAWVPLGSVRGAQANGAPMTWAVWDTSSVPNGAYAVRVTARDARGESAVAVSGVLVQN